MAKQPEHEEAKAASDSGKPSDGKAAEGSIPPAKAASVFLKLKLIAGHAMRGSSVLSILALIVAVYAVTDNLSNQVQLSSATAKVDSLNASLLASKGEMEELKLAMTKNNVMLEAESKKNDEMAAEIIRNITNLQIKLKVYPTLEEQLIQQSGTNVAPVSAAASSSGRRK